MRDVRVVKIVIVRIVRVVARVVASETPAMFIFLSVLEAVSQGWAVYH